MVVRQKHPSASGAYGKGLLASVQAALLSVTQCTLMKPRLLDDTPGPQRAAAGMDDDGSVFPKADPHPEPDPHTQMSSFRITLSSVVEWEERGGGLFTKL